jgi:hypothetical protein
MASQSWAPQSVRKWSAAVTKRDRSQSSARRFGFGVSREQVSGVAFENVAESVEYIGFYGGELSTVLSESVGGTQADPTSGTLSELVCGHLVLGKQFREPKTHKEILRGIPTLDNTRAIPNRGNTLEENRSC